MWTRNHPYTEHLAASDSQHEREDRINLTPIRQTLLFCSAENHHAKKKQKQKLQHLVYFIKEKQACRKTPKPYKPQRKPHGLKHFPAPITWQKNVVEAQHYRKRKKQCQRASPPSCRWEGDTWKPHTDKGQFSKTNTGQTLRQPSFQLFIHLIIHPAFFCQFFYNKDHLVRQTQ